MNIYLPVLAALCCSLYVVSAAPTSKIEQEIFVETELSVLPTCNCTLENSKYCSIEGTCSSAKVGRALKKNFGKVKAMMSLLREFPGDRPRRENRDRLCKKLTEMEEIVDLMLVDFEEWEPVCARIVRNDLEIHTCSLAPKDANFGRISNEEINSKLQRLYKYLGCSSTKKLPNFAQGDFHYCRTGDFCNGDPLPIYEEDINILPQQFVDGAKEEKVAGFSTVQILLYFVAPLLVLLVLIIVIAVVVYSKPGAWSYVFPVAKVTAKNLPH